jgi:uncharacterized protein (TIGR01777 family)
VAPSFERETTLPVPIDDALAWHARPGAFRRLVPPWQPVELVKPNDGIEAGATLTMRMPILGPVGITWRALHEAPHGYRGFRDVQASGPFNRWEHDHMFESSSSETTRLVDRVSYRLPLWPVAQPVAGWAVRSMIERMFAYRHEVTRADLARHAEVAERGSLRVAITGATGMVGDALAAFLTTGGHQVLRLVRGAPKAPDEVRWDPSGGAWDASPLEGCDAIIHLAGENIAARRWTATHKARVLASRVEGTRSLVAAIGRLTRKPRVLLSASAIGYYGAYRPEAVREDAAPGDDFMAEVCREWEAEAEKAVSLGLRVAEMRIGVVLSPAGGALAKMLPAFQFGAGGPVGNGRQKMSWVSLDDVLYAIHFLLMNEEASGAFNLTAPNPSDSATFAKTLGRVLHRPSFLPLPAFAVRAAFGEMGEALLLGSIDARPERLEALGFRFEHPDLESALRHVLGRQQAHPAS